jgi:hypothetical protein
MRMSIPHPDAPAVDRIGTEVLMEHFDMTRQAVSHWRRNGVPKTYRNPVILLAQKMGIEVPEMGRPRNDITRERASAAK